MPKNQSLKNIQDFRNYWNKEFQFAGIFSTLERIFRNEFLEIIEKKFVQKSNLSGEFFFLNCRELARFLYLSIRNDSGIFFSGNECIDQLWHALIQETSLYKELCDRLCNGRFLHHSGITLEDYTSTHTPEYVREEQFSWMASYYSQFGDFDVFCFENLFTLRSISELLETSDLNQLNQVAKKLAADASSFDNNIESIFLNIEQLTPIQLEDPYTLISIIKNIHSNIVSSGLILPSLSILEQCYSISSGLGFLYWQHCAAVERLLNSKNFKTIDTQLYEDILSGKELIGLGTTHLVNRPGSLKVSKKSSGYLLNGVIPWVSGFELFSHIIVGFQWNEEFLFTLIAIPKNIFDSEFNSLNVEYKDLSHFKGTSSIQLELKNHFVSFDSVLNSASANVKSQYICPELGLLKRSISLLDIKQKKLSSDVRAESLRNVIEKLKKNEFKLRKERDEYLELKDERNAVVEINLRSKMRANCSFAASLLTYTASGSDLSPQSKFMHAVNDTGIIHFTPKSDEEFTNLLNFNI